MCVLLTVPNFRAFCEVLNYSAAQRERGSQSQLHFSLSGGLHNQSDVWFSPLLSLMFSASPQQIGSTGFMMVTL